MNLKFQLMWRRKLGVAFALGVLFAGSAMAGSGWGGQPPKDKLIISIMVWKAAQLCPDFPISVAKAQSNIMVVAKRQNEVHKIEHLKKKMSPRLDRVLSGGFKKKIICNRAASKALEVG